MEDEREYQWRDWEEKTRRGREGGEERHEEGIKNNEIQFQSIWSIFWGREASCAVDKLPAWENLRSALFRSSLCEERWWISGMGSSSVIFILESKLTIDGWGKMADLDAKIIPSEGVEAFNDIQLSLPKASHYHIGVIENTFSPCVIGGKRKKMEGELGVRYVTHNVSHIGRKTPIMAAAWLQCWHQRSCSLNEKDPKLNVISSFA